MQSDKDSKRLMKLRAGRGRLRHIVENSGASGLHQAVIVSLYEAVPICRNRTAEQGQNAERAERRVHDTGRPSCGNGSQRQLAGLGRSWKSGSRVPKIPQQAEDQQREDRIARVEVQVVLPRLAVHNEAISQPAPSGKGASVDPRRRAWSNQSRRTRRLWTVILLAGKGRGSLAALTQVAMRGADCCDVSAAKPSERSGRLFEVASLCGESSASARSRPCSVLPTSGPVPCGNRS